MQPTTNQAPKKSNKKVIYIAIGIAIALVVIFSPKDKKAEAPAAVAGPSKSEMLLSKVKDNYAITKQAIAAKVSNPNSLDIHQTNTRYFVSDTSMNLVVCEGTADALNDLGVEKEFKFSVLHRVNGEQVIIDLVNVSE